MCRHAAYIGPAAAPAPMMTGLEHSLLHQSYAARELLPGVTVNADGFGLVWYDLDVRPEPARYASGAPIWSDANLSSVCELVQSELFMGAVRSATVAGSNIASNSAPFADGRWSWSLNGFLSEFQTGWRQHLETEWLSPERRNRIQGTTDAEFLFQAFLTRLDAGDEPTVALRGLLAAVHAYAATVGLSAQLNILAADGDKLYAVCSATGPTCNTLYHLNDGTEFPGAHVVASEPLMDDSDWEPIPAGSLMVLQAGAPAVRLPL